MSSIENILNTLSLKNKENNWNKIINNSFIIITISKILELIEKFITPITKDSLTSKLLIN
ncbi:MAG: hypothetical protein KatS3mg068_2303 [Candidatus Sericytochromatia bacterium]|nr:MAG: hypothetical protein KatS3mg068_2303 [Candidatus Sericytochromatia bacterium]